MRQQKRKRTPLLNDFLHDRNRYKVKKPDFYALGELYPDFKKYLHILKDNHATIQWNDPFAVRELTRILLHYDFGLDWTIPINRLCPPLSNRLNYLHWIEDLLLQVHIDPAKDPINAIDIGTGANCIYPLLGTKLHYQNPWSFVATEIDQDSFQSAKENIKRNGLEKYIDLIQVYTNNLLTEPLGNKYGGESTYSFLMCNPPFFGHENEKDSNPDTNCTGSYNEMIFPFDEGGDLAFISIIIKESVKYKTLIRWFTSLVGRKSTLKKVLALLREIEGIKSDQIRTTEFCQGRTKRWGIAWTFTPVTIALDKNSLNKQKVFAKRRERQRRQILSFDIPKISQEKYSAMSKTEVVLSEGCYSFEMIKDRMQEFAKGIQEFDLHIETKTSSLNDSQCELSVAARPKSNNVHHSISQKELTCGDNSSTILTEAACLFAGDANITECDSKFVIEMKFQSGLRDLFWTQVEAMKTFVVRSSRFWQRKRRFLCTSNKS